MAKASLALAIIARNAEKTIGACLDSVVPYVEQVVVCVDATTTDETAKVALGHGAKVVTGLAVSEWHECEVHGRVLAQHFAKARDASFTQLRTDVDWHGWLDADDVLEGGDKLAEYLSSLPAEVDGVWLPYHYSSVEGTRGRAPTTLFHRERFVRTTGKWHWQNRVHEVLVPIDKPAEHCNWARNDAIQVVHQHQGHDTHGSARRNILLLEIDLEDRPGNRWAQFYLGNQYFALDDFEAAIHWYESGIPSGNAYQDWQGLIYCSMAYERLGDLANARGAALRALDVVPQHPDPYYCLARLHGQSGDVQNAEFFTRMGDRLPEAPFFAFKNPMDRSFNARVALAAAYGSVGRIVEARHELERAAQTIPSEDVKKGIEYYRTMEESAEKANALARVLSSVPEAERPALWKLLDPSPEVRAFGRARDVVMPAILKARPNTQPRIVFWCGRPVEPWAPPKMNETGVGGSETAAIEIAKRFASDGWRVDVYNGADRYEGEHGGVGYWGLERLGQQEAADVLVSWRNPGAIQLSIDTRTRLLWCHDLNFGPNATESLSGWDHVLGVSKWHAAYLAQVYALANTDYVPNGIDLARFSGEVERVPFRCVYASAPDRGLDRLLQLWPEISRDEPAAELHIAYGWETFDRAIAAGATQLIPLKERILELLERTPQVKWLGRLPQDELARLYQSAVLWLYPTSFLEVSCISAMEAMAAGCVPVTSAAGALPETIGDGGLVVPGNTYSASFREFWTSVARGALHDPAIRAEKRKTGQERVQGLTWDAAFERWKGIVSRLLDKEETARD